MIKRKRTLIEKLQCAKIRKNFFSPRANKVDDSTVDLISEDSRCIDNDQPIYCPICNKRLWNHDEALNNLHIDKCLKNEKKEEKISNTAKNVETLEAKAQSRSVIKDDQPWFCPICNTSLWSNDLKLSNMHIDNCLKRHVQVEKEKVTISQPIPSFSPDMSIQKHYQINGLWCIKNFITKEEENEILKLIDSDYLTPWKHSSFNGHCETKCYGVRTQFGLPGEQRIVRQNDIDKGEYDIPSFLEFILKRLDQLVLLNRNLPHELRNFKPNECNINSYTVEKGHHLNPHFDDRYLSGPLLINLSLLGDCQMTYCKPNNPNESDKIHVDLPPRCLQLVTGAARWSFMHGVEVKRVFSPRRVSVTWRKAGDTNLGGVRYKKIS